MTQALDAAWDAVHAAMNVGEVTNCLSCETCPSMPCACAEDLARAALRAALPAEFDAEKEALMRKAYGDAARTGSNPHLAVYRALRAYLLGEDA